MRRAKGRVDSVEHSAVTCSEGALRLKSRLELRKVGLRRLETESPKGDFALL
jgi:hypothetical protein